MSFKELAEVMGILSVANFGILKTKYYFDEKTKTWYDEKGAEEEVWKEICKKEFSKFLKTKL